MEKNIAFHTEASYTGMLSYKMLAVLIGIALIVVLLLIYDGNLGGFV
jgi:hypothetical protein